MRIDWHCLGIEKGWSLRLSFLAFGEIMIHSALPVSVFYADILRFVRNNNLVQLLVA